MKKKTKTSLIDKQCRQFSREILHGSMLSIDPSIGSSNSQPGFAVWEAGELLDSGIIQLGTAAGGSVASRLYAFRTCLEQDFQQPDVLVLERIVLNVKVASYCNSSVIKMNQAIGVAMSQWGCPVIAVSPMSWKAAAKKWDAYEKSDEHDAIALGLCVIHKVKENES